MSKNIMQLQQSNADSIKEPELSVLLFDVDGVIVEPRAYRIGLKKTLEELCSQIGIEQAESICMDDSEFAYYESLGIHDVWDMCNIAFALVLAAVFSEFENSGLELDIDETFSVPQIIDLIKREKCRITRPDYKAFALECFSEQNKGASSRHPPELVLERLSKRFAAKAYYGRLLAAFLASSRSVYSSSGTRLFQNLILGSREFSSCYGIESSCKTESLLMSEDRVLLSQEMLYSLQELLKRDDFKAAVYTARPSLPPEGESERLAYSPEAELAAKAAGLSFLPLVGMGAMDWLAQKHGTKSEYLCKPNTTHSLAALLAALRGKADIDTIELAFKLDRSRHKEELFAELGNSRLEIYVFEDTRSGIVPMQKLAEDLRINGFDINLTAFGIGTDENKVAALKEICNSVFSDINQALAHFVSGSKS